MKIYAKLNTPTGYVSLTEELDSTLYNIGSTYADYLNNMYVELSLDQISFKNTYPHASIKEVINMELEDKTLSIDEEKQILINNINEYDKSDNVNLFYYNDIPLWFDKDTRVGLMNSTTILKNAGYETTTLWYNSIHFTLNCDIVIQMLGALEIYALQCYNVTAEHKETIRNLSTIEEVHNYDYTTGYPEKIHF